MHQRGILLRSYRYFRYIIASFASFYSKFLFSYLRSRSSYLLWSFTSFLRSLTSLLLFEICLSNLSKVSSLDRASPLAKRAYSDCERNCCARASTSFPTLSPTKSSRFLTAVSFSWHNLRICYPIYLSNRI